MDVDDSYQHRGDGDRQRKLLWKIQGRTLETGILSNARETGCATQVRYDQHSRSLEQKRDRYCKTKN